MLRVSCFISETNRESIYKLLDSLGIIRSENADIALVEAGVDAPPSDLAILFQPGKAEALSNILKRLLKTEPQPPLIIGERNNTFKPLDLSDILYFRSDGNYVYAVTPDAEFEVKYRLYELEERFRGGSFIRTGKSNVVNILQVEEIIPWFGSRLLLRISGTSQRIEVSRKYLKSFKAYLEI
ncbi:MAG TPA: hypothetical protein DCO79_07980 [Spirochaeta sp.]|nr:hypothetical protein [Spirochaeta sp.]